MWEIRDEIVDAKKFCGLLEEVPERRSAIDTTIEAQTDKIDGLYEVVLEADVGTAKKSATIRIVINPRDFPKLAKRMLEADREAALQAFAEGIRITAPIG